MICIEIKDEFLNENIEIKHENAGITTKKNKSNELLSDFNKKADNYLKNSPKNSPIYEKTYVYSSDSLKNQLSVEMASPESRSSKTIIYSPKSAKIKSLKESSDGMDLEYQVPTESSFYLNRNIYQDQENLPNSCNPQSSNFKLSEFRREFKPKVLANGKKNISQSNDAIDKIDRVNNKAEKKSQIADKIIKFNTYSNPVSYNKTNGSAKRVFYNIKPSFNPQPKHELELTSSHSSQQNKYHIDIEGYYDTKKKNFLEKKKLEESKMKDLFRLKMSSSYDNLADHKNDDSSDPLEVVSSIDSSSEDRLIDGKKIYSDSSFDDNESIKNVYTDLNQMNLNNARLNGNHIVNQSSIASASDKEVKTQRISIYDVSKR